MVMNEFENKEIETQIEEKSKDNRFIKILIGVNLLLVLTSLLNKGNVALFMVPFLGLANFIIMIAHFIKKKKKIAIIAGILMIIMPIIGFSLCLSVINLNMH